MHKEQEEQRKLIEFGDTPSLGFVALILSVTLVLSVTGPFNTFGLGSFGARLIYWGGLVVSSCVLAAGLKRALSRFSIGSVFWREATVVTAFSAIFTPFAILWTDMSFPAASDFRPETLEFFGYIMAICVAISSFRYGLPVLISALMPEVNTPPAEPQAAAPRFIRRLPEDFKGQVLRLSGDGHYVNVATTQGAFDVRIRFSDAVAEMDEVDGFWVHRSHWVAQAAIKQTCEERGRPVLILTNGDTVPVGAKFKPQLEHAGVL